MNTISATTSAMALIRDKYESEEESKADRKWRELLSGILKRGSHRTWKTLESDDIFSVMEKVLKY